VAEFESSSSGKKKPFASLLEVAGLIFLAEWGDRSMLATIALGAAQVGDWHAFACSALRADKLLCRQAHSRAHVAVVSAQPADVYCAGGGWVGVGWGL
jgi:hypothetical protein